MDIEAEQDESMTDERMRAIEGSLARRWPDVKPQIQRALTPSAEENLRAVVEMDTVYGYVTVDVEAKAPGYLGPLLAAAQGLSPDGGDPMRSSARASHVGPPGAGELDANPGRWWYLFVAIEGSLARRWPDVKPQIQYVQSPSGDESLRAVVEMDTVYGYVSVDVVAKAQGYLGPLLAAALGLSPDGGDPMRPSARASHVGPPGAAELDAHPGRWWLVVLGGRPRLLRFYGDSHRGEKRCELDGEDTTRERALERMAQGRWHRLGPDGDFETR